MRTNFLPFLFGSLICLSCLATAYAESKPLEKITLKPGEEKTFTIKSTTPVKVGFMTDLEMDQMKNCKHSGIQLSAVGSDMTAASPLGTAMEAPVKNGQITFVLKNMEAFPIPVEAQRD